MLDIMRKHASSWMIKAILGAIIVSFVLFFGWSQISRSRRGAEGIPEGHPVATVNKMPISVEEFRFFFDRNIDRLKQTFKEGPIPETFQNFAKVLTLQQLIRRQLLLKNLEELDVHIPDEELASIIRQDIEKMRGEFDPIFYRHQFLPYFEDRYGINYEELTRQDIGIALLESLMVNIDTPVVEKEKTVWTFEVVEIKPQKLTEEKIITDEAQAAELAQTLIRKPVNEWKKIAQKNKLNIETVGPITLSERSRVLAGRATLDDFKEIFALNRQNPVLKTPLRRGDAIYAVRLVEKKVSPAATAEKASDQFLNKWLQREMADAKIVNYLQTSQEQE